MIQQPVRVYYGKATTSLHLVLIAERIARRCNDIEQSAGMGLDELRAKFFPGIQSTGVVWPKLDTIGFAVGENAIGARVYVELVQAIDGKNFFWQVQISFPPEQSDPEEYCPACASQIRQIADPTDLNRKPDEDELGYLFCDRCTALLIFLDRPRYRFITVKEFSSWPSDLRLQMSEAKAQIMEARRLIEGCNTPDRLMDKAVNEMLTARDTQKRRN